MITILPGLRLWLTLSFVVLAGAVSAGPPGAFIERVFVAGLSQPVAFDIAADGTMFVAEKAGRVRVVRNGVLLKTPFIDITDKVNSTGERGLLGVVVHPDFPRQPYVYVTYSYDPPQTRSRRGAAGIDGNGQRVSRLSRFVASADSNFNVGRVGSELIVLGRNSSWANIGDPAKSFDGPFSCERNRQPIKDCIPHDVTNHAIGNMKFAADGSLYLSVGDASYAADFDRYPVIRAQKLNSPLGKVLRIDPDTGLGLTDNPFYNGDAAATRSKVWFYGLRNPFRFTVRRNTNQVYVGNVGQASYEEINSGEAGANFGWPCFEGADRGLAKHRQFSRHSICRALYADPSDVTAPLYAYPNTRGSAVVVGGFSPPGWPAGYQNRLYFADYAKLHMSFMRLNSAGNRGPVQRFINRAGDVTQILFDNERMYYSLLARGQIKTVRAKADNNAPVASIKAARLAGPVPLTVDFDARRSSDIDKDPLSYSWKFVDGVTARGSRVSHTFRRKGRYRVRLTVRDPQGLMDTKTITIVAGDTEPRSGFRATTQERLANMRFRANQMVSLAGWGRDAEDGELAPENLAWSASLVHKNHEHPNLASAIGNQLRFSFPDHGDQTSVTVCLRVHDSARLSDTQCGEVKPAQVKITVTSRPSGVLIDYAGRSHRTPFTVTSIVGGRRSITAPQSVDGARFTAWSDGGEASHVFTVDPQLRRLHVRYD